MSNYTKLIKRLNKVVEVELLANNVDDYLASKSPSFSDLLQLAQYLVDRQFREQALDLLIKTSEIYGARIEIFMQAGELALRLNLDELAVKMFTFACQLDPSISTNFHHLAEALRREQDYDQAIEVLKVALEKFPEEAPLWHALGVIYYEYTKDHDTAITFVIGANRLSPRTAAYYLTLGNLYYQSRFAERYYKIGIDFEPDHPELNKAYGIFLLLSGRMEEAWPHYEYRLECEDNLFEYDVPLGTKWDCKARLSGPILVLAEQGIGDEVAFSPLFADLIKEHTPVYIACEARLLGIFERSFPSAHVFAYEDVFEFDRRIRTIPMLRQAIESGELSAPSSFIHAGSLMQKYWRTYEDLQKRHGNVLKPSDPVVDKLKPFIEDNGRKKIAISWTSQKLKGLRRSQYYSYDVFADIAQRTDADFYILQYDCPEDVRKKLCKSPNIHSFEGIDLKADVESNLAILSMMDLAIGPFIATQAFAASVGTPVWGLHSCESFFMFGHKGLPNLYAPGSRWVLDYHAKGQTVDAMIEDLVSGINAID